VSIARHFAAKVAANLVGLSVGLVTLALVPRTLGPEAFGRYEFLANFFQQVKGFLDMGTSICFYTRLSQNPGDKGLVGFYLKLVLGASVLIIGGGILSSGTSVGIWLWAGEPTSLVALAACLGCLSWGLDTTRKMVDAYRLTVPGEMLYALSRVAAILVLVALIWKVGIGLTGYFVYQIAMTALVIGTLAYLTRTLGPPAVEPVGKTSSMYIKDFWDYSHPLFLYALIGVLTGLADRWLLQTQAGAIEQGFFGLAYQVGAVCFLFTSAMTQLLTRDFAVAWGQKDIERMRALFRQIIPALYAVAAYFCVFVAFRAADVAYLFGGGSFERGAMAMTIMAFYPMHQTYGQLSGSVFYATGQTRLYRNIGIIGMIAGLPLMFWLIASIESGGLGLGAVGLALKMVLLQAVFVNVQLWFNARLLSLDFWRFLAHQLLVPAAFALCAYASTILVDAFVRPRLGAFLLAGVTYTILVIAAVWTFPQLCGLRRDELAVLLRRRTV
jgi:O-antigen/teichoic acid export membrane protein